MSNVVPLSSIVEARWERYVSAQRRAQETLSVEDGIAAGRAWREWLNLYMSNEQRNFIDGSREGMIG